MMGGNEMDWQEVQNKFAVAFIVIFFGALLSFFLCLSSKEPQPVVFGKPIVKALTPILRDDEPILTYKIDGEILTFREHEIKLQDR
jgi:hypothetical protein